MSITTPAVFKCFDDAGVLVAQQSVDVVWTNGEARMKPVQFQWFHSTLEGVEEYVIASVGVELLDMLVPATLGAGFPCKVNKTQSISFDYSETAVLTLTPGMGEEY